MCLLWQGTCNNNNEEVRTNSYLEALSSMERAIALAPEDPAMWKTRVTVLEKLRRFDQALQSIEHALELAPTDYIAWNTKGSLLVWYLSRPQ
jgi:Flp pilus assembly protein TadD